MSLPMRIALVTSLVMLCGVGGQPIASAEISENLFENPSFEDGITERGDPTGWALYQARDETRKLEVVEPGYESDHAVLIEDNSPTEEIGIGQVVPADGGLTYEAAVMVYVPEGATGGGSHG